MKKVVFLIKTGEWGGAETLLLDYLAHSDYMDNHISVISSLEVFADKIEQKKIPVKFFYFSFSWGRCQRFWRLLWLLSRIGVDEIIFWQTGFLTFKWSEQFAAFLAARGNVYFVENQGAFPPLPKSSKRYFGVLPGVGVWWYVMNFFIRIRPYFCRGILAVCEEVKQRMIEWYGFPQQKIAVVHSGVDLKRFSPDLEKRKSLRKTFGIPEEDLVIISTARLSKEKCLDRLIDAFERIYQEFKNSWLIFVGEGPERANLEKLAREKMSTRQIMFTGFVENIVDYLRAADVYVLPSDMEGFSLAMLEAMAVGLIPVRTKTCGASEVIVDGENGFLTECSAAGVYQGLREVFLLSFEDRKAISKKAQTKIEQSFNRQKNLGQALAYLNLR